MLIEIHAIQNHSPANLNRDDLGAPKTCYFGGVMRTRISSQCIKRSIRTSEQFARLLGGTRTRKLANLIAEKAGANGDTTKRVLAVLAKLGLEANGDGRTDMAVYVSRKAIDRMADVVRQDKADADAMATVFAEVIRDEVSAPDMALTGRMLKTTVLEKYNTTVEAALQAAHAISTHEARPEVDYFVAADDQPENESGAAYLDEAMFASACFYKYFSIHWETLVENLKGNRELAAHTVGAFLRAAAIANPSGKQNSFAAHNPPDGIVVELKKDGGSPISYANAFADPVPSKGSRDVVSESIARLGQYIHDLDTGYGKSDSHKRFWFSPNLRHPLSYIEEKKQLSCADQNLKSLDDLVSVLVEQLGFDWKKVQQVVASA